LKHHYLKSYDHKRILSDLFRIAEIVGRLRKNPCPGYTCKSAKSQGTRVAVLKGLHTGARPLDWWEIDTKYSLILIGNSFKKCPKWTIIERFRITVASPLRTCAEFVKERSCYIRDKQEERFEGRKMFSSVNDNLICLCNLEKFQGTHGVTLLSAA